jgi:hypothetical protein
MNYSFKEEKEFDFDVSSNEWRKNKIKCKNGYFQYKCQISNCNEPLYSYTTNHKLFYSFATPFDIENKNHINKNIYCEEHLQLDTITIYTKEKDFNNICKK